MLKKRKITRDSLDELRKKMPVLSENEQRYHIGGSGNGCFWSNPEWSNLLGATESFWQQGSSWSAPSWNVPSCCSAPDWSAPNWGVPMAIGSIGYAAHNVAMASDMMLDSALATHKMLGGYASEVMRSATIRGVSKVLGHLASGIGLGMAINEFVNSDQSGADKARLTGAILITLSNGIPKVGPAVSFGLNAANTAGAFNGIYNLFK